MTDERGLSVESKTPPVVVALSTYNGERYVSALLDSLLRQDYLNFRIIIRDDGSSDSTPEIIDSYCGKCPDKISVSRRLTGNLGVAHSFLSLLEYITEGEYLMFCDQDDIWFDGKISTFMFHMLEMERSGKRPTLVFGDMVVVDHYLDIIAPSFWAYQRLDLNMISDWRKLMISNVVSGCSSMCNSAAIECLRNAPLVPVLHDHLAAILVARDGVLSPLKQPTMLYRQHQKNVEGARKFGMFYLVKRLYYFAKIMVPRYRIMCEVFSVPVAFAVYLKTKTLLWRLINIW